MPGTAPWDTTPGAARLATCRGNTFGPAIRFARRTLAGEKSVPCTRHKALHLSLGARFVNPWHVQGLNPPLVRDVQSTAALLQGASASTARPAAHGFVESVRAHRRASSWPPATPIWPRRRGTGSWPPSARSSPTPPGRAGPQPPRPWAWNDTGTGSTGTPTPVVALSRPPTCWPSCVPSTRYGTRPCGGCSTRAPPGPAKSSPSTSTTWTCPAAGPWSSARAAGPSSSAGRPGPPGCCPGTWPAALADDHGPPAGQVQVVDVEGEDFAGPGGAPVEQPPQGPVPYRVLGTQEGQQVGGRDSATTGVGVPVEPVPVSFQAHGRGGWGPALPGGVGEERAEGGHDPVPRRCGQMGVAGGHELGQHPGADLLDRGFGAEVVGEPGQREDVNPVAARGEVAFGEERGHRR